ncbi:hypothetical protein D3C75_1044840 [compost metagenome]
MRLGSSVLLDTKQVLLCLDMSQALQQDVFLGMGTIVQHVPPQCSSFLHDVFQVSRNKLYHHKVQHVLHLVC